MDKILKHILGLLKNMAKFPLDTNDNLASLRIVSIISDIKKNNNYDLRIGFSESKKISKYQYYEILKLFDGI